MKNFKKIAFVLYSFISLYLVYILFSINHTKTPGMSMLIGVYVAMLFVVICTLIGLLKNKRWGIIFNYIIGAFSFLGIILSIINGHVDFANLILFLASITAKLGTT